jgi:hypothetical protein
MLSDEDPAVVKDEVGISDQGGGNIQSFPPPDRIAEDSFEPLAAPVRQGLRLTRRREHGYGECCLDSNVRFALRFENLRLLIDRASRNPGILNFRIPVSEAPSLGFPLRRRKWSQLGCFNQLPQVDGHKNSLFKF